MTPHGGPRGYHDEVWGIASHEPTYLFEILALCAFAAGIRWTNVWRKRDGFRAAFLDYQLPAVAAMTVADVDRLMTDTTMPTIAASYSRNLATEVRTVQLDPDRAPLIEWAYKAYASGDGTVSQLHDELTSRGPMSLPTPRHPSKPLAVSSVHRLLTNPHYKGYVIYRGVVQKGPHEPLIPAEVW